MGWFGTSTVYCLSRICNVLTLPPDDNRDAHQQVYGDDQQHEAKFSHELIGGAAAFEAMKAYEDSQRRKGMCIS